MSINSSNNRPMGRSVSFTSPRMKDIKKHSGTSLETQMRRMHSQKNIDPKISSTPEASGDFIQVGTNTIEVYKLGRGNAKPKAQNDILVTKENKRFRRSESMIERGSRNIENISIKNEKTTHGIATQHISRDLEEGEISPEEDMCFKKRKMIQEGKQEAIRQDVSEDLEEGEISPEKISPEKGILEKLKIIHSMSGEQKDAIFDVLGATGLFPKEDIKITKEFLSDTSEMPKQYIHNDGSLDVNGYYKRKTAFKELFGE